MKLLCVSLAATVMVGLTAPTLADWDEGDGHKMHYPQLPDPNGIDISFRTPQVLADDWLCTWSGPVDDIHFWFSAQDDLQPVIFNVHVSIHADIPADPNVPGSFSRPANPPLWERDYGPDEVTWRPYGTGQQGWYVPENQFYEPFDHLLFYQMNIDEIEDPFYQEEGTIYWLDISISSLTPLGWKTSRSPQFNDTAVWGHLPNPDWLPIYDPRYPTDPTRVDLAFVITPEPGSFVLLACAGALLIRRKR